MTIISTSRLLLAGGFSLSLMLTACVSKNKYAMLEAENTQLRQQEQQAAAQRRADEARIADDQAQIARLQGAIKYSVESDLLFAPGSWELSEEGKRTISRLAPKLAPTQENKLVVNGYTDSDPIGPRLEQQGIESNQDLSQKRAEAVRAYLISQGMAPDKIEAVGHAEANPVASNDTSQGRAQNRRVELTLGG